VKINSQTFAHHGQKRMFLRDPDPDTGAGGGGGTGKEDPPADDKGKGYKPPATQEELDRIIEARLARERSRYADYDTYKASHEKWQELERESQTDIERREREIREEAFMEAMSTTVPLAVRAEFKAAAKGVLTPEALEALLEDVDLTKYASDDGTPDEDKIAKKITALAPKKGSGGGPGFGQGAGHDQSTTLPGERGALEAQRRFGKVSEPAKS
jgi:hypothetical protein